MKRMKLPSAAAKLASRFKPELMVVEFVATRRGDAERGPLVRMNRDEARARLVDDGELVWVEGPRRKEIAVLKIDDSLTPRQVALRDIAGVTLTEKVTVTKPDLDNPPNAGRVG